MSIYGQNGITFQVEELSKPGKLLQTIPPTNIWESLIIEGTGVLPHEVTNMSKVPFDIIAQGKVPDHLVNFGYHSFFNGMYTAYADHRPFVLSPDIIWLLITQGFAQHINANPEEMRDYFVDYSGKQTLVVTTDKIKLDDPQSPWDEIFPEFTRQIAENVGNDFIELFSADFSTTTPVEKLASEITIMNAMKPYFEFVVMYVICGIPEITLTGTPDDWKKILDKTRQLSKYDLSWWTNELEPLLQEFVNASEGNIVQDFWRNMFKSHSTGQCAPKIMDGWIVKFFPYNKQGKRNNLKNLKGTYDLPNETVKVDLKYVDTGETLTVGETTLLELWAGFIGLEQNSENFALKPVISWMIRKKDIKNELLEQKIEKNNHSDWGQIFIRVKEVPPEICVMKEIKNLKLEFINKIIIPDELSKVKIGTLILSGEIDGTEIERIKSMFPDTELVINNDCILNCP
jgi:hypothetical protein